MHTIKKPRKYKYRTRRNNNKKHSRKFIQKRTTSNRKLNRNRRETKKMRGGKYLHNAIKNGDSKEVEKLLEDTFFREKKDINKLDNETGDTPLNLAIKKNNSVIVQILLKNSADYTIKNVEGDTPLTAAIKINNPAIVELLLENNPHAISLRNGGPLLTAVKEQKDNMVKLLLMSDKIEKFVHNDYFELEFNNSNPLYYAVENGTIDMVQLFLENENFYINYDILFKLIETKMQELTAEDNMMKNYENIKKLLESEQTGFREVDRMGKINLALETKEYKRNEARKGDDTHNPA